MVAENHCSSTSSFRDPERQPFLGSNKVSAEKCFFCDSSDGDLHRVLTFQLERKVKQCAVILEDMVLLGKLIVGDMIAQDAMYYTNCLLTLYRKSSQKSYDSEYDDHDKLIWSKQQSMDKNTYLTLGEKPYFHFLMFEKSIFPQTFSLKIPYFHKI